MAKFYQLVNNPAYIEEAAHRFDYEAEARLLLGDHYRRHPEMELQDAIKFSYHQINGSAHMLAGRDPEDEAVYESLLKYLTEDYDTCQPSLEKVREKLSNNKFRLHLYPAREAGLKPELICRMMVNTAKQHREHPENLAMYLRRLDDCFPAYPEDMKRVKNYIENGMPPVSHTTRYKELYKPAYRIINGAYAAGLELILRLQNVDPNGKPIIVGLDGCCGSGKSTVARAVAELFGAEVISADDYFLPRRMRTAKRLNEPGGNLNRERLLKEVLAPIKAGAKTITTRRYDCATTRLLPGVRRSVRPITIVEGSYCLHPELWDYYDIRCMLLTPGATQQRRIVEREGIEYAQVFFDRWIPMEEHYFRKTELQSKVDLVLWSE